MKFKPHHECASSAKSFKIHVPVGQVKKKKKSRLRLKPFQVCKHHQTIVWAKLLTWNVAPCWSISELGSPENGQFCDQDQREKKRRLYWCRICWRRNCWLTDQCQHIRHTTLLGRDFIGSKGCVATTRLTSFWPRSEYGQGGEGWSVVFCLPLPIVMLCFFG